MLKTDALLYFGSKTKLAQAAGIRLASLYSWKAKPVAWRYRYVKKGVTDFQGK